jgi:hypothetical protein
LLWKFYRRTNQTALLVTILESRNKNKKRFKNRMKSPQSQRIVKTILRLIYIPRPIPTMWRLVRGNPVFWGDNGEAAKWKIFICRLIPGQRHKRAFNNKHSEFWYLTSDVNGTSYTNFDWKSINLECFWANFVVEQFKCVSYY